MINTIPKHLQEILVEIHTQRWTNIGLAIAFFFTAFFTLFFINTVIPTWWNNITDSLVISIILDILLFIPVGFLLIMCIVANEHFNSVKIRIGLLIGFSLLASIFIVFIFCSLSDFKGICSTQSLGAFLFYTLFVMFTLFAVDAFLLPFLNPSRSIVAMPWIKTILSLPMVFVIWRVTQMGWVWLIPIQVFIIYFFYIAKVYTTWARLRKKYEGNYSYKCLMPGQPTIKINMFKNDNYRLFGLFLSLYTFLPNIFLVFGETVNNIEIVNDSLEKVQQEREPNILSVLYDDNDPKKTTEPFLFINLRNQYDSLPDELYEQIKDRIRIIKGIALYIFLCFILSWMGNLFEPFSI